jgi:hypothetical protein
VAEKPPTDRAGEVARLAKIVILQMRNDGARIDPQEICEAVVVVFATYHFGAVAARTAARVHRPVVGAVRGATTHGHCSASTGAWTTNALTGPS